MTFAVGNLHFVLGAGRRRDYVALERFHYRRGSPATFAAVWTIRHIPWPQPIAVAVLSYPTLCLHVRNRVLGLAGMDPADRFRFVNRHVRTISRVIVHPTFRSLGLAPLLVRHILNNAPTRYVEALAVMGRAHPFFQSAGMRRIDPCDEQKPIYYLFDRNRGRRQPARIGNHARRG